MGSPYTSARNGLWDASDVDTWGQGLGVYPQTAADVVNIAHLVTYNKSSTTPLGHVTINNCGLLTFATTMNTKLTLGHQDIYVNAGGELRVGSAAAPIPAAYTAEIAWNTTSDAAKGIYLNGGTVNIYDDPAYYGADDDSLIYSNWSAPASGNFTVAGGNALTIEGDFSAKWAVGHELMVHRGSTGGNPAYVNDFAVVSITAISYDGTKTVIEGAMVSIPGGAATFYAKGDVANLSRNVMLYKSGYSKVVGNYNANRPIISGPAGGTGTLNISGGSFAGFANLRYFIGGTLERLVCRNGNYLYNGYGKNVHFVSGILFSCNYAAYSANNFKCDLRLFSVAYIAGTVMNAIFGNTVCGSQYGITTTSSNIELSGAIYSCQIVGRGGVDVRFTGKMGYDADDNSKPNQYDIDFAGGELKAVLINVKQQANLTFNNRNSTAYNGRIAIEHYKQVTGDAIVFDAFGTITKAAHSSPRPGGSDQVLEVSALSNIGAYWHNYLTIFSTRLWLAAGAYTMRFYCQTDYATLPAGEIKLSADYLDQVSGGRLATASSTQGIAPRASVSDWSQYLEVSFTSPQAGWVTLYIRLTGYESGKYVWVDPQPVGAQCRPRWSLGEMMLEPPPGQQPPGAWEYAND